MTIMGRAEKMIEGGECEGGGAHRYTCPMTTRQPAVDRYKQGDKDGHIAL